MVEKWEKNLKKMPANLKKKVYVEQMYNNLHTAMREDAKSMVPIFLNKLTLAELEDALKNAKEDLMGY